MSRHNRSGNNDYNTYTRRLLRRQPSPVSLDLSDSSDDDSDATEPDDDPNHQDNKNENENENENKNENDAETREESPAGRDRTRSRGRDGGDSDGSDTEPDNQSPAFTAADSAAANANSDGDTDSNGDQESAGGRDCDGDGDGDGNGDEDGEEKKEKGGQAEGGEDDAKPKGPFFVVDDAPLFHFGDRLSNTDTTTPPRWESFRPTEKQEILSRHVLPSDLLQPPSYFNKPRRRYKGYRNTSPPMVFRACSFAYAEVDTPNDTDKVILPQSVLSGIPEWELKSNPLVYEMSTIDTHKSVYCGVLEFTAKPGNVYVPYWLMEHLAIEESTLVKLTPKSVPPCSFVKFKPLDSSFYQIANPKAELENILNKFTTLTLGASVPGTDSRGNPFKLTVVDLQPPGAAVHIVDTDVPVDFVQPDPEISTESQKRSSEPSTDTENTLTTSSAFTGTGHTTTMDAVDQENASTCANCKAQIPKNQYDLHIARCERLNTLCSFCGAVVRKDQIEAHMQTNHGSVTCKCGQILDRSMMKEHEISDCVMRLVQCPFCTLTVCKKDSGTHFKYCGAKTATCSVCGKSIVMRNMEEHVASGCKFMKAAALRCSGDLLLCPKCLVPFVDPEKLYEHMGNCQVDESSGKQSKPPDTPAVSCQSTQTTLYTSASVPLPRLPTPPLTATTTTTTVTPTQTPSAVAPPPSPIPPQFKPTPKNNHTPPRTDESPITPEDPRMWDMFWNNTTDNSGLFTASPTIPTPSPPQTQTPTQSNTEQELPFECPLCQKRFLTDRRVSFHMDADH
ncbi:ubiquitin fusion degradation protein 1 [Pelomyxa schiedti]|nr:ubiquitin fusion degradation protein 1 [Pelomyxa schiedti]